MQDGATTKKMLVNRLTTASDAAVAAHIADTVNAHMAGAIGASPNTAPMTGTDVQTQLQQAATALAASGTSYTNEQAVDAVAVALQPPGSGIAVTYDDPGNRIILSASGVPTAAVTGLDAALAQKVTNVQGVAAVWSGPQAAYDGIVTKSPTTLYFIT